MRLRRLDLARYGKFTDRTIDFASILCARPAGEAIRDFTISEWERVRHRVGA